MKEYVLKIVKAALAIEKSKLYKVLPLLWAIETVYLAVNFVCQHVMSRFFDRYSNDLLPDIVWMCNSMVLDYFERFDDTVFILSLVLLFTGFCLLPLVMSFLGSYSVVRHVLVFPLHSSAWLFFISITYTLYCDYPIDFVLLPFFLIGLEAYAVSKIRECSYIHTLGRMLNRISFALNKGDPAYPRSAFPPQDPQK